MIKRELMKDERLKNESWDRFLPKFRKKLTNVKKKPKKIRKQKDYTPFPPPPAESKIDKQLQSGEYFLKESERQAKKMEEKRAKQMENVEKSQQKRQQVFIPPPEKKSRDAEKKTLKNGESENKKKSPPNADVDIKALKSKVKMRKKNSEVKISS